MSFTVFVIGTVVIWVSWFVLFILVVGNRPPPSDYHVMSLEEFYETHYFFDVTQNRWLTKAEYMEALI